MKKILFLSTCFLLCTLLLPITASGETTCIGIDSNTVPEGISLSDGSWTSRNSKHVYSGTKNGKVSVSLTKTFSKLYIFSSSADNSSTTKVEYNNTSFETQTRSAFDALTTESAFDTDATTNLFLAFTIEQPTGTVEISVTGTKNAYFWFMVETEETTTTPALTGVTPNEDATNVAKDATITFSYNAEIASDGTPSVTVTEEGTELADISATTDDYKNFTITGVTLDYNKTYEVSVGDATTTEGTAIAGKTWSFTTEAYIVPQMTTVSPEGNAVSKESEIVITYDKPVVTPDVQVDGTSATVTANDDNTVFTVTGVTLSYATSYTVTVAATQPTDNETATVSGKEWSFTVESEPVPSSDTSWILNNTTVVPTSGEASLGILSIHGISETSADCINVAKKNTGYLTIAIPAGVGGTVTIVAAGVGGNRKIYAETSGSDVPGFGGGSIGSASQDTKTTITYTVEKQDNAAYVHIYNEGSSGVNYYSITWTPDEFIAAVLKTTPANGATGVTTDTELSVTYNTSVATPTITVKAGETVLENVTITANDDNTAFIIGGIDLEEGTVYTVSVSATRTEDDTTTDVAAYEWTFTTVIPANVKYIEVFGEKKEVPATGTNIDVVLPYYCTSNYQDIEDVITHTTGVDCTVGSISLEAGTFESEYNVEIDGAKYVMHMSRAAFRTSGELTVTGVTAGALYLMPTQPIEKGNEPVAITIVADVTEESQLTADPAFTGNIVWCEGDEETVITPEIVWDEVTEIPQMLGYTSTKIYGRFTYNEMDVKIALIRSLMPSIGQWRVWTVEDIDVEQYLPNGKGNSITFRGVKIHAAKDSPKTPVRVTYFDVTDPDKTFTLDSYGPFRHSLKMGGSVDSKTDPTSRFIEVETQKDEVITVLAQNGSNTDESKFQIKGPQATSRERLLPSGTTAWWSHRVQAGGTAQMYGFDAGNGKGGNVAYSFIEVADGIQYDYSLPGIKITPMMATVEIAPEQTRVLTSSNQEITIVMEIDPAVGVTSFRESNLSIRKIGEVPVGASMSEQNLESPSGASGNIPDENISEVNLISQNIEFKDGKWLATVVVEPQTSLEGDTYYELWSNHASFIVKDETLTDGVTKVTYETLLYRIYTLTGVTVSYDFEYSSESDFVYPNNVYASSSSTSVSAANESGARNKENESDVTFQTTGNIINGDRLLMLIDSYSPQIGVGFDTPDGYPGEQVINSGYTYVTADVYIPADSITGETVEVRLYTKEGTPLTLVDPMSDFVYDSNRNSLVPVVSTEAYEVKGDQWYKVIAASATASSAFPAFEQTERIYLTIEGATKAYVDNVTFIEAIVPTAIENVENAKSVFYNGREVVNNTDRDVEVYNIAGALVMRGNGNVDLSCLSRGIYIVRCGNEILKISK